jgi:hypothetical protein
MPIVPRTHAPCHPRIAKLGPDLWFELCYGRVGVAAVIGGDLEMFKQAWNLHREAILEEWIERRPGTRPLAWWICDHGHERPFVKEPVEGREEFRRRYERFGFLHTSVWQGPLEEWGTIQEPETDYLRRMGQLALEEITDDDDDVL